MGSSSNGKMEVPLVVKLHRKLGTFDAGFEREINAWAEANADESEREDNGSEGLQREFTREEAKQCVANRKNRQAAGADQLVIELMKYGGEEMLTSMVVMFVELDVEKRERAQEVERRRFKKGRRG